MYDQAVTAGETHRQQVCAGLREIIKIKQMASYMLLPIHIVTYVELLAMALVL